MISCSGAAKIWFVGGNIDYTYNMLIADHEITRNNNTNNDEYMYIV